MPKRTREYNAWLIERLTDPHEAERYLQTAKADSPEMFLKALRKVAEAKKMAKVAEEARVNRESLYKTLSPEGNPEFFTIEAVLNALGMTLTPQLLQPAASPSTQVATISAQETEGNVIAVFASTSRTHNLLNEQSEFARVPVCLIAAQSQIQEAGQV